MDWQQDHPRERARGHVNGEGRGILKLLAFILACSCLVYLAGLRADRALTKPGEHPPSLTSLGVDLASPGSVSEEAVRYRGKTAAEWASKFRHRTRQLQKARASVRAIILGGYGNDWLERAFLCIHNYEGSWTDPNAPFYGGLQMDLGFQQHYGAWALRAFGTADRWPVSVQISTAIQAYKAGRGFYPWPNTARNCGLI